MSKEDAEDFMKLVRQDVGARQKSASHKIKTKVWYLARDKLRHAPQMALTKVGSAIPLPYVGGVINAAIESALAKVMAERKAKKLQKYRLAADNEVIESLRKLAKVEAKDLKTLSESIDGNLVKLKDKALKIDPAIDKFQRAVSSPTGDVKAAAYALAAALYETRHYEDKMTALVVSMEARLAQVKKYIDGRRTATVALEDDLTSTLENYDIADQEIGPARRDGYQQMK